MDKTRTKKIKTYRKAKDKKVAVKPRLKTI